MSQQVNLLQVVLSPEALQQCHGAIVKGRLADVTNAVVDKKKGYLLETYLNESTVVRTRSFGFTLGIGKWLNVGGKDSSKKQWVVRRSLDRQHRQEAFSGIRGYDGKWVGQTFRWAVDLTASMPRFSAGPVPLVSEYQFGLHTLLQTDEKKLSARELEQWLDVLALWRICPEGDVAQVRAALQGAVGQPCSVCAQVTAGDEVVRRLLPLLANLGSDELGDALGAAMPWADNPDGLARASQRRSLYGPLWKYYLKHPGTSPGTLAGVADSFLRDAGHLLLAFRERQGVEGGSSDAFTFAGLATLNPTTSSACLNFVEGAAGCTAPLRCLPPTAA